VIRIRRLSKEYPGGTRALDEVSLDVAEGEFVALIGPSGAGKSSLLRCVNGLVVPTSGEIVVDGLGVTGALEVRVRQVRARIGFIFQQFNLLRRLTVIENVLVGRLAHAGHWRSLLGWFATDDVVRGRRALERVGLEGLADSGC
jgi:phosphonate transport system ATP-binding protein